MTNTWPPPNPTYTTTTALALPPPVAKRSTLLIIIAAVLAATTIALLASTVLLASQVSKARAETDAVNAVLTQTQADLSTARNAEATATSRATTSEARADKAETCARGLLSTLDSAVDEDWITAYGALSEVKATCEGVVGAGT